MVKILFTFICVLLLQPFKASCQTNWKLIIIGLDGTAYYLNSNNIVKRKTSAVVWVKNVKSVTCIENEQKAFYHDVNYVRCDSEIFREILDFKNNRIKTLSVHQYLDGNQVFEKQNNENDTGWQDIVPDTIGDAEFVFFKKYLHIEN